MRQLIFKRAKIFIFSILLLIIFSCDKIQDSQVPNTLLPFPVDLINNNALTIPGNALYFPFNSQGGVIVYCALPGEYYAFDGTCTHEISTTCRVIKDEEFEFTSCPCLFDDFIVTCQCCGSEFNLAAGAAYPISGPAIAPLRQYKTSLAGNILRVYN